MENDDISGSRTYEYQQAVDPSLVKHLIDFEEVIDSIRRAFAGEDVDYSQDPPEIVKMGDPLLNKHGMGRIVTKLKTIHKGIPVGTLDDRTPYIFTRFMSLTLAKEIFDNWDEYGVKSESDADKIVEIILSSFMAAFSRSVRGAEKLFIKGFARENRSIEPSKGGRFSL